MEHPWDMVIQICVNEVPGVKKWSCPRGHTFREAYIVKSLENHLLMKYLHVGMHLKLAWNVFGTRGFKFVQMKSLGVKKWPHPREHSFM